METILSNIRVTPQLAGHPNQLARVGAPLENYNIQLTVPMSDGRNRVYDFVLESDALAGLIQLDSDFLENRQGTPLALGGSSRITEIPSFPQRPVTPLLNLEYPLGAPGVTGSGEIEQTPAPGNPTPVPRERGPYKLPPQQQLSTKKGFFRRMVLAFSRAMNALFQAIARCFGCSVKKAAIGPVPKSILKVRQKREEDIQELDPALSQQLAPKKVFFERMVSADSMVKNAILGAPDKKVRFNSNLEIREIERVGNSRPVYRP